MPKKVNLKNEPLSTNKAYEVILTMDKGDRKRLRKFLESPFFSNSETLLSLYECFCEIAENSGAAGFNKKLVWLLIFKNEDYQDLNFRKYCSDLFKLIEKYLARPLENESAYYHQLHLAEKVHQQKITPLSRSVIADFDALLKNDPLLDSRHYFFEFKKGNLEYELIEKENLYKAKVNFEDISNSLDKFYLFEKLKILNNVLAHKRLMNVEYEIGFSEEIYNLVDKIDLNKNPGLSLFYYTFLLMKEPDVLENFYLLKENLFIHYNVLDQKEIFDVIVSAMNFCINKSNRGDRVFYKELFDLIKFGTEKNIFILNGVMETWRFTNFIYSALQNDEFEWAEKFIEQNKQYLPSNHRENTVSFNLARIYRKKGEMEKVIEALRNVEFPDANYNMNSKIMLIMAYYDLQELDALDYVVDAYKVYLNRHKDISLKNRKLHLSFLKYIRKLIRLIPGDRKTIEKIKLDLEKEKATTVNHEWLFEKLNQLTK